MPKPITKKFLLPLIIMVMGSGYSTRGGGFQINMLSMKPTSMAGVATGFGRDASSVFYNPGAMSFLERSCLSMGAAFSIPSTSYLSPYTGNSEMEDQFFTPFHFYGVGKINEKMFVGASVNTPFRMRSKWSDDWSGRYIVKESNLNAVYVQPTFSYAISEKLGAGIGPVIAFGRTFLTKDLPVASSEGDVEMEIDGRSTGYGFNLGLFFKPNEDFTAGLNYRSSVKMDVNDGDAKFSYVPLSLASIYPSSLNFSTEYTLPSVITAGAALNVTRELVICMDVNYTFWNSFDSLSYEFEDHSYLDYGSGKFYENAFAIRIGAQYEVTEQIDVRAGVAFDQSPVPDEYVSPENPDADRFMFSLGGTKKFGEHFSLDLAYMLQNIKEREITNVESNFGGNYKSLVNIFGFTLNYQF